MGVQGLLKYLRDNHASGVLHLPLSMFQGKRMAIDVSGFMYRNMATARNSAVSRMDLINNEYDENLVRKIWYSKLINIFCDLLSAGILPVIVFDGKGPELKAGERKVRAEKFAKQAEEIRSAKENLAKADLLDKPRMAEELRKAYKHDTTIHATDHDLIRIILSGTGLPCLQSTTEADHLCASLCLYGEVAAVFSADSDILTHGAPLVITGIMNKEDQKEAGYTEKTVVAYHLGYILESLHMSLASFVDFCIMCGCDYNGHMDGRIKGIGPGKAEKLIRQYQYIEDIPQEMIDKTAKKGTNTSKDIYLYKLCREQFSHFPLSQLIIEFKDKRIVTGATEGEDVDDPYASDEEYIPDNNDTIGGLKMKGEVEDDEDIADVAADPDTVNIFGNRKNRYHLVSDSNIRAVFEMANIGEKASHMRNIIWGFLEKYEDCGEAGHLYFTYVPKIHIWDKSGALYVDGELFEEF